jgi:hypothetical protein
MDVVMGRQAGHLLGSPVKEQREWLVSCAPECRNRGPWHVYGPGPEVFHCVVCGRKMKVVRA